jgi:hypothetical protein
VLLLVVLPISLCISFVVFREFSILNLLFAQLLTVLFPFAAFFFRAIASELKGYREAWHIERMKMLEQRRIAKLGIAGIHDGYEFETFVAERLKACGLNAEVTKLSGDQGVDVIAITSNGTRIAIQTKFYQIGSVGNKAIQEVHTGSSFYSCKYAVVVTTSTFTKQAVCLASAANVILVDKLGLEDFLNGKHFVFGN